MTHYNSFAGGGVGRIEALSDGIFAFAATVLVLDFRAPDAADIHTEAQLLGALAASAPRLLPWLLSLLTLGIFWVGQQTQLNRLERSNRDLSWLHLVFLAAVTALPFTTRLLTDFLTYRAAFLIYWANIFVIGALPLRHVVLRRTGEVDRRRGAWRHLTRAQTAHRRGAVALRDRCARRARQRAPWDRVRPAHSAQLRDRGEAPDPLAPLGPGREKPRNER
jgi:uncharacterized membrane protein